MVPGPVAPEGFGGGGKLTPGSCPQRECASDPKRLRRPGRPARTDGPQSSRGRGEQGILRRQPRRWRRRGRRARRRRRGRRGRRGGGSCWRRRHAREPGPRGRIHRRRRGAAGGLRRSPSSGDDSSRSSRRSSRRPWRAPPARHQSGSSGPSPPVSPGGRGSPAQVPRCSGPRRELGEEGVGVRVFSPPGFERRLEVGDPASELFHVRLVALALVGLLRLGRPLVLLRPPGAEARG